MLAQWQRCDVESLLVRAELRQAERAAAFSCLRRSLRAVDAGLMQRALRTWTTNAALAAAATALRHERARIKEAEYAVELAQEAEASLRLELENERRRWHAQQQEELALVTTLGATESGQQLAPPPPPMPQLVRPSLALEGVPPPRRLGTRAETLLAAFKREAASRSEAPLR